MSRNAILSLGACMLAVAAGACGDDDSGGGTGSISLSLEAEDTIPSGLDPGTTLDNIRDGWTVRYQKVLFTAGNVLAKSSDQASEISEKKIYLLDLKQLPATGFPLLDQKDVDAVRYDKLSFSSPVAKSSFAKGPSVSSGDLSMMVDSGWSIYIEGEITKSDGESCTPGMPNDCTPETKVSFAWGANAATNYMNCGPAKGASGFAVVSGGTTTKTFTIHGDHWFFDGFPEGAEIVMRQAQWVANADLDHDGETTPEELKATAASDLLPASYTLTGSPIPIKTGYDFFVAQSHTIGHFQGEGDCEWDVVK